MPTGETFDPNLNREKPGKRTTRVRINVVRPHRGAGGTAMPTAEKRASYSLGGVDAAPAPKAQGGPNGRVRIGRKSYRTDSLGVPQHTPGSGLARLLKGAFSTSPLLGDLGDKEQQRRSAQYQEIARSLLDDQLKSVYQPLEHPLRNPASTGLDLATILPFSRLGRAGLEVGKALKEGEEVSSAARAGAESYGAGKGLGGPILKAGGRGVKKVGSRVFKVGNLEAKQAHADSRIGRAVERALDRHREALSKVGLMNSIEEKAGRRSAAEVKARADVGTSPGDALLGIVRHPKFTRAKDYSLRIMAEHSLPGNPLSIEDRRAFHLGRVEEAKAAGDNLGATYHRIHARLIKGASKYLHEGDDGEITIAADAPKDLKQAWRLLQKTAAGREDVYRDIGRLSDQQIARRIQAPARVFLGARWMPDEKVVQKVLDENPKRSELFDAIDQIAEDPAQAQAAKDMIDASARHYAELSAAEGNHDPVTSVDELFSHLAGTSTGLPEGDALEERQGTTLAQRAHTGPFGDENYGDLKGAYVEPPSSAGEVAIRAAQRRGVVIKGALEPTTAGAIVHLVQGHADLSTVIHEWGHFLRQNVLDGHSEDVAAKWAGATFDKEAGKWVWNTDAEEKFARGLEQWAREGNGPAGLKPAWKTAAKALREIYDHTDLPDVSPDMRRIFDRLFSFDKQKGGRLLGAEDFHYGVNYVPYTRGAPVALSREAKVWGAYIRHRLQLFSPGRASAIGRGPDDITLRKSFTGALIRSGMFKADVSRASVQSLHTAWRLMAAKMTRDALLQAAQDLPGDATWLAIKVDPEKNLGEDVKRYWDRIHSVEGDGSKLSAHDLGELDHADDNSVDEFIRDLFPAEIEGQRTEEFAQQLSARAGEEMASLQEPIENIKWIPKELLDATGLTQIPSASNLALRGLTKQQRIASKAAGIAFDAFNDIQRAGLLILSPSYIPVNLIGNVAMNVLHQGPLAFPNLIRSVLLHRELELEDRVAIDKLMGHGIMESVLSLRTSPGELINHTIGHWSGIVVDRAPRRAAFLHEAHKAGYDTADELRSLLHDEANTDDLVRVRDKATEAIVDYERMSPFERNVVSRAIFVYPWIKGATHYSIRFAANHPVETMALALMADNAVDNANSELGPRPFYAQLEIPVDTKSLGFQIPGTGLGVDLSQAVGEHKMVGKNGLPYTVNPQQLLTQTTPYELGSEIAGTAGAPGLESLAGSFNPGLTTLATFIAGYDPTTHQEIPQTLSGMFGVMKENFAAVNKIKAVQAADPENRRKLYPRSKNEAIESLFLSGMAPKPFNTKKANALTTVGAAAASPEEQAQQWVTQTQKALGIQLPHEVIVARNSKASYEELEKEQAKKTPTGKLSDVQHDRLLLHVLTQTHPEFQQYEQEIWAAISKDPSGARTWIEDKLGWQYLERLDEAVNKVHKAHKLETAHG